MHAKLAREALLLTTDYIAGRLVAKENYYILKKE